MSSYDKGYNFEWRLRNFLKKLGWVVIRASKSKPVDLVVLRNGNILFIECKKGKSYFGKEQREIEKELADRAGAILVLVTSENIRKFKKAMEKVSEAPITKEALMNALSKFIVT